MGHFERLALPGDLLSWARLISGSSTNHNHHG